MEICIISDLHLGTFGCQAKELLNYLKSVKPKTLILNGDIIDIWQFNKRYFPASHMAVIKQIFSMASKDTKVIYITGNHDETLRKFKGFKMGDFEIQNKLILDLPTGKAWIFHGDVFDTTMKHSKWVAKLGGKGYDLLIMLNTCSLLDGRLQSEQGVLNITECCLHVPQHAVLDSAWIQTIDEHFEGENADTLKRRARKMSTFLFMSMFQHRQKESEV